jgi:integrase
MLKFRLLFKGALERSGIEDFHFHGVRHTFASNLVMAGAESSDVRELLGHKRMEMTLRMPIFHRGTRGRLSIFWTGFLICHKILRRWGRWCS